MSKIVTATPDGAPADASANDAALLSDDEAILAAFGANDEDTPDDGDDESDDAPELEPAESDSDDDADDEPSEDDAPAAPVVPKKTAAEQDEERRAGLRLEDYTQKTMLVAEEKRQAEAARQEYTARLALLADMLSANAQEPNWDEMRVTHTPEEVTEAFTAWAINDRKRAQVQAELQQEQAKTFSQMQKAEQERIQQEVKRLRAVLPEGKSDETFNARVAHLTKYGISQGFTPDELAGTNDHRAILLLDKAERYDALVAKAKTKGKTAPAVQTPSVTTAKPTRAVEAAPVTVSKAEKNLRDRLNKTGDPKAAEELFFRRLGGS